MQYKAKKSYKSVANRIFRKKMALYGEDKVLMRTKTGTRTPQIRLSAMAETRQHIAKSLFPKM